MIRALLFWTLALAPLASAEVPFNAPAQELSAPYDLRKEPRLTKGELKFILSQKPEPEAEIKVRGNHLEVRTRPLSFSEVFEFLRRRSSELVSRLREAGKEDLSEQDRLDAVHILHERYMLLSEEDHGWLEGLFARRYGKIPGKSAAGSAVPETASPPRPSGLLPAGPEQGPGRLRGELRRRLEYPKDARQWEALDNVLDQLMKSPTARELARDFIGLDRTVQVSFGEIEGSKLIKSHGKKTFTGMGGYTEDKPALRVVLNKNYLPTDPDGRETASMLAHELLGHARQGIKAEAVGVHLAYDCWEQNEVNAGLIGWAVMAELGLRLDEDYLWKYLADPAGYPALLKTYGPYYAGTYSLAEMSGDIPAIWAERKAQAQRKLADLDKMVEQNQRERSAMEHFIKHPDHRMPASNFLHIREALDNEISASIPYKRMNLKNIIARMDKNISIADKKSVLHELAQLRASADNAFFLDVEEENTRHYAALLRLARGRTEEEELPPLPAGQLSQKEFKALCEKDEKIHPDLK